MTNVLPNSGFFVTKGLLGQISTSENKLNGFTLFVGGLTNTKHLIEKNKHNFLEKSINFPTKNILIEGFLDNSFFKKTPFKKLCVIADQKKKPEINIFNLTNAYSTNQNNSLNNFLLNNILGENIVNSYSDLDDESRVVKRGVGKTTPIRLLKKPKTDFFFKNGAAQQNIELLAIRFNDKTPTIVGKPIKPAVYLTFKQKRYNQRTSIGKKSTIFYSNALGKKQTYSGNPFLKDMSIIEENFGNPTRQYRLLKKAKTRLDTTRISN